MKVVTHVVDAEGIREVKEILVEWSAAGWRLVAASVDSLKHYLYFEGVIEEGEAPTTPA